jgi:dihydrolipoamide dehydrogenase
MTQNFDVVVIGAGPGGYVAAIKAAQLGLKVASVDKRLTLGGTCLNVGCIPSKALLNASQKYMDVQNHYQKFGISVDNPRLDLQKLQAYKEGVVGDLTKGIAFLYKKNGVSFFQGTASFNSANSIDVLMESLEKTTLTAKHIIIATGSEVATLKGVDINESTVVTSTGALALTQVPERLLVIGGGYIGLELGSVWKRLGADVTVVEYADRIVPMMDDEVGAFLMKTLQDQGISFKLKTKVERVSETKGKVRVTLTAIEDNKEEQMDVDVVLSCAGRRPCTDQLNLSGVGIKLDAAGRIVINNRFETNVPGIYAIGDVVQGPMLAHKAEEEGVAIAEILAGQKPQVNYDCIPSVIYTHPEVASVGKTEQVLVAEKVPYTVGKFPFLANSRARTNSETLGFVKILAHKETDEVLGVHIVHAEAGTMIAEAVLAMEYKASAEDIARTCHAHPTLNEALKEAALATFSKAIHI